MYDFLLFKILGNDIDADILLPKNIKSTLIEVVEKERDEKMTIERKEVVNKANLVNNEIKDHTTCEECLEEYLFLMRDKDHEFYIGLNTILSCLAFAEKEGIVPKLPEEWWCEIRCRY